MLLSIISFSLFIILFAFNFTSNGIEYFECADVPVRIYSHFWLSTIGDRALAVAGPRAENNLLVDLHLSHTFSTFKTDPLKSHLFNISFPALLLYHRLFFVQSP